MPLRALLFDFDGTLAETERDGHRVAYNLAFEDLGLHWHWDAEQYGTLLAVTGGKERIAHFVATERPPLPSGDLQTLIERIHRRKTERFKELAGGIALRPGAARLIAEAKAARIALAIATTANENGVRAVLEKSPATLEAFDVIAAGDVVRVKKPAPDVYRYALTILGIAPDEAVAFEDSAIGLAAAHGAGIATIALPSAYSRDESFSDARAVLTGYGDRNEPAAALAGPAPQGGLVTIAYLRGFAADSAH